MWWGNFVIRRFSTFHSDESNVHLNARNSVLEVTFQDIICQQLSVVFIRVLRHTCDARSLVLKWILVLPSTRFYPVYYLVRTYSPSPEAFIFSPAVTCSFIRACVRKSLFASIIWFSPQVSPFFSALSVTHHVYYIKTIEAGRVTY